MEIKNELIDSEVRGAAHKRSFERKQKNRFKILQ